MVAPKQPSRPPPAAPDAVDRGHAIFKTTLHVGELAVPVKLYSAVEDRRMRLRVLHAEDLQPVVQQLVNPRTGEPVPAHDVRKGYEVEPGRFVLLDPDVLAELEPRPRGTSRPWIIGAAVLGVSLAAAVWASRPKDSEPCSRYVEAASERWNPAARERVREAFVGTGLPYATTVAATVSADLDAHVARWIDESTSACLDRVPREGVALRGGTPAAERSRCLDRRLRDIGRLVERLEQVTPGDVSLVDRAYELVAELPPLDDCTEREPPATTIDPAQLVALDEALGATHVAMTLADWEAAERHAEHARTLAVELALEPEELEATIGLGRAQLESEEPQRGRATLEAAARRAEALGDDRLAWLGWVHLAQLAFEERSYRPQAGMWLAKAESAGSRLEGELRRKRLEFEWANLGLLEDDDAIPQLMGVWGWLEGHGEQLGDFKIATGMSLAALLLASEDAVQAVPYAHEAMRLAEQRRGASHPSTVMARLDLGMGMIQQCLLEDAEVELRSADAGAEALGHVADRARILLALAQIYFYTGRAEEAKALLAAADPLVGPDDPELVQLFTRLLAAEGQAVNDLGGAPSGQAVSADQPSYRGTGDPSDGPEVPASHEGDPPEGSDSSD